jgi:hypothetical protein
MSHQTLRLAVETNTGHSYTLQRGIPAVELVAIEKDRECWGPLIKLPRGASLEFCGDGFDSEMLRVRSAGCLYVIFRQDLDSDQRDTGKYFTAASGC